VTGQRDVLRVGAVAVDDRGDLAGGPQTAGETLAEVLAQLSLDLVVVRHGGFSLWASAVVQVPGVRGGLWFRLERARVRKAVGPADRCDHGCRGRPSPKFDHRGYQRPDSMESRPDTDRRHHMEAGFLSHVILWIIAAIAVTGTIGTVLSFFTLGRQAYR